MELLPQFKTRIFILFLFFNYRSEGKSATFTWLDYFFPVFIVFIEAIA